MEVRMKYFAHRISTDGNKVTLNKKGTMGLSYLPKSSL